MPRVPRRMAGLLNVGVGEAVHPPRPVGQQFDRGVHRQRLERHEHQARRAADGAARGARRGCARPLSVRAGSSATIASASARLRGIGIRAEHFADDRDLGEIAVLIGGAHARLAIANPSGEEARRLRRHAPTPAAAGRSPNRACRRAASPTPCRGCAAPARSALRRRFAFSNVVCAMNRAVPRSRAFMSSRNPEWSHTPASTLGCSIWSISAAIPPTIMPVTSIWTRQPPNRARTARCRRARSRSADWPGRTAGRESGARWRNGGRASVQDRGMRRRGNGWLVTRAVHSGPFSGLFPRFAGKYGGKIAFQFSRKQNRHQYSIAGGFASITADTGRV